MAQDLRGTTRPFSANTMIDSSRIRPSSWTGSDGLLFLENRVTDLNVRCSLHTNEADVVKERPAVSRGTFALQIRELEGASKLSRPNVVVGVPEIGLVGTIAASYLVEHLGLPEVAFADSDMAPQVVIVKDSQPKQPIRIFGKGTLAVVVSEVPLTSRLSFELASQVVAWARAKQCKMIVGMTGIPSEARVESGGDKASAILAVTNDAGLRKSLKSIGAHPYERGIIISTYATLLKQAVAAEVANLTLLAESYAEFPDPGAAAASLDVLSKLLSISVDVKPLLKGAEEIRLNLRGLMNQTQQAIQQQGGQAAPTVYR